MNRRDSGRWRGQPLRLLVLVVLVWSAGRYVTWSEPFAMPLGEADFADAEPLPLISTRTASPRQPKRRAAAPATPRAFADPQGWQAAPVEWDAPEAGWSDPAATPAAPAMPMPPASRPEAPSSRVIAGHTMMMAAGFSQLEVPPAIAALLYGEMPDSAAQERAPRLADNSRAAPYPVPAVARRSASASRWSADGWLMWRDDTTTPVLSGRPSYGRSQAGAVVRYRLAPGNGHAPQAYARASSALEGAREREAAVGLSARPLARVPLRLAAEMRVSEHADGTEIRPAAFAVTELAPQQMPGGFTGEVYLQGGYVGGRNATAFVDGQARVDRSLADAEDFDLRAGGGVWGGAQEDGARLDIGPSASVTFRMGEGRGRLAADYRFRVAGDAEPSSGPALTLSAGF